MYTFLNAPLLYVDILGMQELNNKNSTVFFIKSVMQVKLGFCIFYFMKQCCLILIYIFFSIFGS